MMLRYLNELYFGQQNWILEIQADDEKGIRLDTCFLATRLDTARFITHAEIRGGLLTLVTPDSLDHPLQIRSSGDTLFLCNNYFRIIDNLEFSESPGRCSINRGGSYYTYLDRTPTLGAWNDTSGAMGWVCGTVSDEKGIPVTEAFIAYEYQGGIGHSARTDASGQYRLRCTATQVYFWWHREGYQDVSKRIPVYPDCTTVSDIILLKNIDAVEKDKGETLLQFSISENYPNPFNSVTRFQYSIPSDGFTDIGVFDVRGKSVETLFHGFQKRGEYRLFWDAFEAPSGIYFCRIQSGNAVLVKKWILIR